MGDGGSLLLGLLMAAATVSVGGSVDEPFSGQAFFFYAPLLIPLFVLGVPLLDTVLSVVRRAIGRKQITEADKNHLHYQLVRMGHGNRRAVLILWAWTALLSGLVLYPTLNEGRGDALGAHRCDRARPGPLHRPRSAGRPRTRLVSQNRHRNRHVNRPI